MSQLETTEHPDGSWTTTITFTKQEVEHIMTEAAFERIRYAKVVHSQHDAQVRVGSLVVQKVFIHERP